MKKNKGVTKASDPAMPGKSPDGEMKKAGEFNGDLRDLPKTKPIRRDRPKREEPKITPRPYPTPGA